MKQIWYNLKYVSTLPNNNLYYTKRVATNKGHIKNMKDIWQHTSGTMYIRWIKFGGGGLKFLMRRIVRVRLRNLSTITRDWNWPLPLVSSKIFLKLNIKMYTFYCQLYLLPKPEAMGKTCFITCVFIYISSFCVY